MARLFSLAGAGACISVLAIGASLSPDPRGHSTHEQLGLASCSWPTAMGIPCPMCGMTTATCHAANGDLPSAFMAQPMGAVFAISAAVGFWILLYAGVTGSRVTLFLGRLWGWRLIGVLVLGLLIAWGTTIVTFRHT